MSKRIFVGVDPGNSGAICFLDPATMGATFINLNDPLAVITDNLAKSINQANEQGWTLTGCIESVHAIQGTSAKSNFQFGFNTGAVTALMCAAKIPLDSVTPKKWQAFLGVRVSGAAIKKDVAHRVIQLYPSAEILGPRGGLLDGRSDALAIAHYHFKHSVIVANQ